jgi:alpha-tubulin suppressor-like RCC1 family protein
MDFYDLNIPRMINGLYNIIQVSAGNNHSLMLNNKGRVYAFGANLYGQLGITTTGWSHGQFGERIDNSFGNNNISINKPTLIQELNNITKISAGHNYCLVLNNQGQVYAFGQNIRGELGLGDYNDRSNPTLIPTLNNIIQISAGNERSYVLDKHGNVYGFGQLGLNNRTNIPILIPELHDIIQISCGLNHSIALNRNGEVYTFGNNYYGQLGSGDNVDIDLSTEIDLTPILNIYV